MRNLSGTRLLLLLVMVLGLSACGDNYYTNDFENTSERLCANTWIEQFKIDNTDNSDLCKHYLIFGMDYTGREIFEYYRPKESTAYKTNSFNFSWNWIDDSMEGLELNYGAGDISFFDNVLARFHYLSGSLDGVQVTFTDYNYFN